MISFKLPKISIITPSFNQGQYIEQTIQSVIAQKYPNLEFIIIDGGSTDNTVEIIKKYEKYLAYWVSEPDRGQAHAINKGLEKATGDIFNWLNSDDYLEPGSLLKIGKYFAEFPETEVLCGYTHCFFEETGKTSHTYRMGVQKTVTDTILKVEMNQPGSYYKMDVIKSLVGVNESLRYVFDDELFFRFLCKFGLKNIAFTDKLICHFRLHENSKSVGEGFSEFWKELTSIYYEMAKQIPFPVYITELIKKDTLSHTYIAANWDFTSLEKDYFEATYCKKYQYLLYKDFKYDEAKYTYQKQKKYYGMDKKSFILYIKLYIIPKSIMIKLRNYRNRENE